MKSSIKRKVSFFSVLFTFFVDNLGWSIVFPIFAPLFLDSQNLIFSADISFATRTAILGLFLAAFPLAQFFGAPILGEFADKVGRKKALIVSIFLTFLGYILTGYSIKESNLYLLFLGRLVTGLFSGNLSVCLASISDLSKSEKSKAKNFGFLSVLAGFSFIVGAFLGGKLSDSKVYELFSYSFPLWVASFLSFMNLLFIIFGFEETLEIKKNIKYDFLEGFHNIKEALKTKNIKTIYLIYFLFVFSWTILFQFTPVLVIKKFSFTNSQIGDLAAFMGICWAIGSGIINKLLSKRFSNIKVLETSLFLFTILCGLVGFPKHITGIILLLGSCVIIGGVAWPICATVISNKANKHMQGKIMGISQSMQSLAMAVAPIIGGLSDQIYIYLPFIIAAFASLIASLVYFKVKI
ncbi:MAG: Tetracycline resistance protein, class B [Candidatus Anoxychlamydiales bacterium]|nr:Tetracycline resistance protein, class B [Candidatus Anoxychlamydiales bacterium]